MKSGQEVKSVRTLNKCSNKAGIKTSVPQASVLDPDLEKFNYIFQGSEWVPGRIRRMAYLKYFLSIAYTEDSSRIESLKPVSPMSSFLYLRDRYGSYEYDKKVGTRTYWNFTYSPLQGSLIFLFSCHCLHEREKSTSSKSLLQRNHRRGIFRIVESTTRNQENTPIGKISSS
jgi:hypothetical protein